MRFGAQHSQSVENWAMAVPGLKVVAPSNPQDVVGLLAAAIRDPDPVLFFEQKSLYAAKGEVADGEIVDELLSRGIDRVVRRHRHRERPQLLALMRDRDLEVGAIRGIAERSRHSTFPVNRKQHPRGCRSGASREDLSHTREHVVGRVGAPDAIGELRKHLVGRCSRVIDDAVGQSPRESPQGTEQRADGDADDEDVALRRGHPRPDDQHRQQKHDPE